MKEEKLIKLEIDDSILDEEKKTEVPLSVEYSIITTTDFANLKNENLRAIEEIDSEIQEIEEKIDKLNSEIDTLTNQADNIDYITAAICGIITGMIDSVFVGKWDFGKVKADANEKINNEVIKFAKKNPNYIAWCNKNGKDSNRLVSAISFLEKTYKLPGDSQYKDFKNLGINDSTHHLDDLRHHPTLIGLLCSIITQFTEETKYYSSNGTAVKVPVTVNDYGDFVSEDKWGKVFAGIINWFFKAAKTIQNQKGHLMSDVAGSLSSASKGNSGVGLPGSFISILKELSTLPCFSDEKFSENLRKAYQNGIGTKGGVDLKAFNVFFEGASSKFDLRTEMTVKSELKRQAFPVVLNEILVRGVYFISRFIKEMKVKQTISEIDWKNVIPIENRTIVRMMTIATGTFTAFDVADAALRSGGFNKACILRINIVGVGRFAVAIMTDITMEIKKNAKVSKVIEYQGIENKLLNAKVYYGLSNEWIAAKDATEAIINASVSCERMLMQEALLHNKVAESSNEIKQGAEAIRQNYEELAAEMLKII